MEIRPESGPKEVKGMTSSELRSHFLISSLMKNDEVSLVYSYYDRLIIGSAKPARKTLSLPNEPELRAEYFLERRELGIINVGADGVVEADGQQYDLSKLDTLYLGKGTRAVSFCAKNADKPACFYLVSAPAHHTYPNTMMRKEDAMPTRMGTTATANQRTIYKYLHLEGIKSCQLVMGLTVLDEGSVWNTMPPHTHTRRTEAYFYFDVPHGQRVFHMMGEPQETRHIIVADHEAVISPPWSVHCGAGTSNYGFIWAMAGENLVYSDMDAAPVPELK